MLRSLPRAATAALLTAVIFGGCSAAPSTVSPHRGSTVAPTQGSTDHAATPASTITVASCPAAPPAPVLDPTARFVLQTGHQGNIMEIELSADGRTLASSGGDGTVRVWDVRSGLLLRKFGTAGSMVNGLSLSGNGKQLAYYAPDGTVDALATKLVDLDQNAAPQPVHKEFGAFKLTGDGTKLVIAGEKLRIFDTASRKVLHEVSLWPKYMYVQDIDIDEQDKRLAVAVVGEVVVVDIATGAILHRVPLGDSSPRHVAIWKDYVVVNAIEDGITVYPMDLKSAPRKLPGNYRSIDVAATRLWVTHSETVASFSLPNLTPIDLPKVGAPTGDLVATSADGSTVAFSLLTREGTRLDTRDAETLRPIRSFEGRASHVIAISMNSGGDRLVAGSGLADLDVWNLRESTRVTRINDAEGGARLSISHADKADYFASMAGPTVHIRDGKTGQVLRAFQPNPAQDLVMIDFIPNTNDLMTGTKPYSGKTLMKKSALFKKEVPLSVYELSLDTWNADEPWPQSPTRAGKVAPLPPKKHLATVTTSEPKFAAMSPHGDTLALGTELDVQLIRLDTGKVAWVLPLVSIRYAETTTEGAFDDRGRRATFSPDGKTLLISTIRHENKLGVPVLLVVDVATGRITKLLRPETNGAVAWRNDLVFIGGKRPVLLDAQSMSERVRVKTPDNAIIEAIPHPTRNLFVIGGDGGATSFVDERGNVTATLFSVANGEWIAATSDGAYRSSFDGAHSIAWTFASPLEAFAFERFAARFDKPNLVTDRLMSDAAAPPVALSRPPSLQLESTRGVVRTAERSINISAKVASASRVDRVRAFIDGRPVAEQLVCATAGNVSLTIPLHAGQNRVGVVAYDAAGQASNTENLDILSTSPLTERPNLHVVAIGVSRYPNMTPDQQLDFADDDAKSVAEAFAHHVGPDKPFARLFSTVLLDDQVSVDSIEKAIAGLQSMRPDDLGVVFFAGHGAKLAEGQMVFMTNQAAFTRVSAEKYGIHWDKIHAGLSAVRGRVLMMLDACHSGHLTTEIVAPNEDLARQLAAGNRAGVFIFAAARGSQFSFEVPPTGTKSASRGLELAWDGKKPPTMSNELTGGHGLFTSALLEALHGEAPDRDRSGATEVGELVDYVSERVREASNGKQTPWVARREMFGEFFVVPAKK